MATTSGPTDVIRNDWLTKWGAVPVEYADWQNSMFSTSEMRSAQKSADWSWSAPNATRTGAPGWIGQWKRFLSPGWSPDISYQPASAFPKVVDLESPISIMGHQRTQFTITGDGAVYLMAQTSATASLPGRTGSVPVLLPFGDKLEATENSQIRYGYLNVGSRIATMVFVVEFKSFHVKGLGANYLLSTQVVVWPNDGLVQFFYDPHTVIGKVTDSELALYRNVAPWIGYAQAPNLFPIDVSTLLVHDKGNTSIFDPQKGMRPGWFSFNPSAQWATVPSLSLIGKSEGESFLDIYYCNSQAFHLIAWDFSRDLFAVGTHPRLQIDYMISNEFDTRSQEFGATTWSFEEFRWGPKVCTPEKRAEGSTDCHLGGADDLGAGVFAEQKEACKTSYCSMDIDTRTNYNGVNISGLLQDSTIVDAIKFSAVKPDGSNYSIGLTPSLLRIRSVKLIHDPFAVNSGEIYGSFSNLNPLGLKASFYRESQEDSPIPTVALTKLFEIAPATVNAFNFYVESVQDANGGSVPVDVVFKSGTLGFVTKQRNWNGNFTVVVKVVRKSDEVSSTIPVFVTVFPGKDAPVIFQGDKTNQLPYHIVMYGQEASTPINLASTDLVWDDESPLTSLVWTPTFTGATPQPQIDYPLLNSNNQLKLFFGTDAPPSGIWNLSLKATDPTSLSDSKVLTVHRFASSIEVVPNSQVLTQLSPTGEVLAQFRVLLPKNHDALELKELVMGVWYSDRDMNILDHSPLDIGTCRNAPDGVRVECPVSFRYEKNAMAENPHTGDQFKLNEIFVEQMSFYVSIDLKHRNDQVQILFPMTDMDFAGPVMEASIANTQFIADKNSFSQRVSFQLGSENLKSLSLSVIQTCSGLATQSTVHDPAANNSAWLAKGVKNTWIQENIPSFCSVPSSRS